ncbi:MAG: COG4315 family predicted lipoprotein [Acidimicrobiales bacterium]
MKRRLGRSARSWLRAAGCTAGVVALVVASSGCTASGTAISTPYVTSRTQLATGPTYEVRAGAVSGLGTVLVDGQGLTLYLFATDQRGLPSRCYAICAVQWPPVLLPPGVTAPVAGPGIRSSLLGTVPRSDGSTQLTYHGWPLYRWPLDRAPGMATGQGIANAGGRWYALTVAGDPILAA